MFRIPLIRPYIPEEAHRRVSEVLRSGYLTEGPATGELESMVGDFIGVKHVLAVCNCTVGLELALRALGVGPGDEVIVPGYTYPATADAVCIVGATPVVVDVDPKTFLIDMGQVQAALTSRTKAIMPVSQFGNPLNYDELNRLKDRHGVYIVEDAACALGASWSGRSVGAWADISVFSMHPRKFVTTGEGGLVTTDRPDLADWMWSYKHFGMGSPSSRQSTQFVRVGTNYKLSNILSAVGISQLEQIDDLCARRQALAARYQQRLADVAGVELPITTPGGVHSWQTFCVQVDARDAVMTFMRERGVEVQIGTYALHEQPAFAEYRRIPDDLPVTASVYRRALALPLYHEMTEAEQDEVVDLIAGAVTVGC